MAKKVTAKTVARELEQLSPEDAKALQAAASATWQYIGYDTLAALAEVDGKNVNRVAIPRDEVIELVIDAGQMTSHGGKLPATALAWWKAASYEAKQQAIRPAFAFSRYGM